MRHDMAVVTGLGVVDASAWGIDGAAAAFANPSPTPVEVDRSAGYHQRSRSRCALLVDPKPQQQWLIPLAARRMSAASRFAVCAAKMAVENAGLEPDDLAGRTAVVLATAYGAADFSERILRQIFLDGPNTVSPALFTESVANAPTAQIALAMDARGTNVTVTQRQAGVPVALSRALVELQTGRAERVLVGVVDEMTPLLHAILDRFRGLAQPDHDGVERARPFDRRRNGWLAAEGAVVALLETESSARRRHAPVLARLLAAGSAFDPKSPRNGWGRDPALLASVLREFLHRVRRGPATVDRVVCSACGHRGADRLEARLLRAIFEESELPPILAPAATSGAYGGSLLAAAILAAAGKPFGPTPGFREPDPEVGVTPYDGRSLPPPLCTLLTACAAGGAAGWALFEAPEE
ncbi:MAG: beta-ketoacyl synthase N-terminal-like domain-containing protein [Thermoanaerobaculales bacterium]